MAGGVVGETGETRQRRLRGRPRGGEWQATTVLQLLAQSRVQAVSGPVLGLQTMTIQFTGVDVSWRSHCKCQAVSQVNQEAY